MNHFDLIASLSFSHYWIDFSLKTLIQKLNIIIPFLHFIFSKSKDVFVDELIKNNAENLPKSYQYGKRKFFFIN